jgi:hypothetical protein
MLDTEFRKYPWLDCDNKKCNSDEYFKQISYNVNLNGTDSTFSDVTYRSL